MPTRTSIVSLSWCGPFSDHYPKTLIAHGRRHKPAQNIVRLQMKKARALTANTDRVCFPSLSFLSAACINRRQNYDGNTNNLIETIHEKQSVRLHILVLLVRFIYDTDSFILDESEFRKQFRLLVHVPKAKPALPTKSLPNCLYVRQSSRRMEADKTNYDYHFR